MTVAGLNELVGGHTKSDYEIVACSIWTKADVREVCVEKNIMLSEKEIDDVLIILQDRMEMMNEKIFAMIAEIIEGK